MEEQTTDTLHAVTDAAAHAAEETMGKFTHKFVDFAKSFLTWENLFKVIGAFIVILLILIVFKVIKHFIKKVPSEKLQPHYRSIILRFVNYVLYFLIGMYILSLFGVKLSAIWGAAGVAGIAIGFAAQTSVSNLISGLFVLGEKTMKVGDFIVVGGVSGTVDSVGLLSIKIHTLDNQMIRIPNSTVINSNFQNNSFFDVRRVCFSVSIDYSSDMKVALDALKSVPEMCTTILKDPKPGCWYDGFGDSGINMTLAVWFNPANAGLGDVKNDVYIGIKTAFDKAGVNIPFNRLDVQMVDNK